MPTSSYYGGEGRKVMASMKKKYGKRAEEAFYATANKRKQKPKKRSNKAMEGLRKLRP